MGEQAWSLTPRKEGWEELRLGWRDGLSSSLLTAPPAPRKANSTPTIPHFTSKQFETHKVGSQYLGERVFRPESTKVPLPSGIGA